MLSIPGHLLSNRHDPIVTAETGPRNMRKTHLRFYHTQVEDHIGEDDIVADAAATRSEIHPAAVVKSIEAEGTNRVLDTSA